MYQVAKEALPMIESFENGRYEIIKVLGQGSMGMVYQALDTGSGQTVAIKVINDSLVDAGALMRFEREALVMSALSHPNIIGVLDVGHGENRSFIVMEFIEGGNLRDYIDSSADRQMEFGDAIVVASQIAQALNCAHGHGVIHRDIKPTNVMLTAANQVKLTDFGVAKWYDLSSITSDGDVVGTIAYMSPEQIDGIKADARSDLYALGCVLFEMIAGHRPFPGHNPARVIYGHTNDRPSFPRRIAVKLHLRCPPLEVAIRRLLAKDPEERFQTAEDLLDSLENIGRLPISRVAM